MSKRKPDPTGFRVAAIYRAGLRRNLTRQRITDLLFERVDISRPRAEGLVSIWFTTHDYKNR
jgi:hypothetical protein